MQGDPTYVKERINENPVWALAFKMSEQENDNAPIGWGRYIPAAEARLARGFERAELDAELADVGCTGATEEEIAKVKPMFDDGKSYRMLARLIWSLRADNAAGSIEDES